jgi:hypothetical protein
MEKPLKYFLALTTFLYATTSLSAGRFGGFGNIAIPCTHVQIATGTCNKSGTASSGPSITPTKDSVIPLTSQDPAKYISIKMKQAKHTHIATLSALMERDMQEHRLTPTQLKIAKENFLTLLDGIDVPDRFVDARAAFKDNLRAELEVLNQGQFTSALTGFVEALSAAGQDELVANTNYIIGAVSPRTHDFLINVQGYKRADPNTEIGTGQVNIANFKKLFAGMESGNSFVSRSSGLMMGASSRGTSKEDGQWTLEDRSYAAIQQAGDRAVQAAKVGAAAGAATGLAVGDGSGAAAGAVVGGALFGAGGALWGMVEGFHNPGITSVKPTGVEVKVETKIETKTSSTIDEEKNIVTKTTTTTTTTTETKKNLETNKTETTVTSVSKDDVKQECVAGAKCKLDLDKDKNKENKDSAGCDKPDMGFGDVVLSPEEQERQYKLVRARISIIQDSLILLLEPRNQGAGGLNKAYIEAIRKSLVRPGTPDDIRGIETSGPAPDRFNRIDPLFDPRPEH